ncbi:MAG: tetratricopeptide repeat protein [Planctomycetaceae bacterium]|nr:tetratricopeptide repeat protein [Planctomycetaceae bacterium]
MLELRTTFAPLCLLAVLSIAPPATGQDAQAAAEKPAADQPAAAKDQARLAALIKQLGAEDFTTRETAQAELAHLGLEAFDALHAAQNDNDPEISLRARYLVRSMSVRWFHESDSPEVVKILRGYGDLSDGERRNRMEQLAKVAERQGIGPLCRLARFETIDALSKYAALKVMEQPEIADAALRQEIAKSIGAIVGNSKRPSADWLRVYAQTLIDPAASLPQWDALTRAEQETMNKHPEKTTPDIVRDLYRWQVELLKRQGKEQEVVEVIRRTFTLLNGTPEQVKELVQWLIHAEKYDVVLEVAQKFDTVFAQSPELLYRLAETQLKLGNTDEGQATAERALNLNPENLEEHRLVGVKLQDVGLHEWAEREFRQIMKAAPAGSVLDFGARFLLSELLHDQLKEQEAADTLKAVCDLMDKDGSAKDTCMRAQRDPEGVYSRMNYFYACALTEQQKFDEVEARLNQAIAKDPTDADALIALYRLPNQSDERKAKTKALIDSTTTMFRQMLNKNKADAEQAPTGELQNHYNSRVALMCNQIAWLMGNTYGDFDEAIRLSQRSLELRPDYPGYLDTLGRCYFAAGDLENAVKYQSQAVKLDPNSGQMRRQLALFKKELAAKGGDKPK